MDLSRTSQERQELVNPCSAKKEDVREKKVGGEGGQAGWRETHLWHTKEIFFLSLSAWGTGLKLNNLI